MEKDKSFVIGALAFVAGFVDTAVFIALFGLFTAYVTGNLSVLAAEIVRDGKKIVARILIIPVFIFAVAGTTLYIRHHAERGNNVLRHTLALEAALLLIALAVATALGPARHPDDLPMLIVGPLMVATLAVQNAATRLVLRFGMATTLMTLNITQLTINLVDLWRGVVSHEERMRVRNQAAVLAIAVTSFLVGGAMGAVGFHIFSFWSLIVPLLALVALAGSRATRKPPAAAEFRPAPGVAQRASRSDFKH